MKLRQRVFSFFLTFALVISSLPMTAFSTAADSDLFGGTDSAPDKSENTEFIQEHFNNSLDFEYVVEGDLENNDIAGSELPPSLNSSGGVIGGVDETSGLFFR